MNEKSIEDLYDKVSAESITADRLKAMFPWNLIRDVMEDDACPVDIDPFAVIDVLHDLTEREQKVVFMRYIDMMTLEDAGKILGVTRDRVRQIEARALRKLRHPARQNRIHTVSMAKYKELQAQLDKLQMQYDYDCAQIDGAESDGRHETLTRPTPTIGIENLELSVRSYNCLKRAGICTLGDLAGCSLERLMKVRNLGRKSAEEVLAKCNEYGIVIRSEEEGT